MFLVTTPTMRLIHHLTKRKKTKSIYLLSYLGIFSFHLVRPFSY